TESRALVEQRWTIGWAGEIRVKTQGGNAKMLLDRLLGFIDERHEVLGAKNSGLDMATYEPELDSQARVPAPIMPTHEPKEQTEYYISYAWADASNPEREAEVNRLCDVAAERGIKIIRDKTEMRNGDRISEFMSRIGKGAVDGRVFIFLSD